MSVFRGSRVEACAQPLVVAASFGWGMLSWWTRSCLHPEPSVATANNRPAVLTTLLQVPIDEVVHLITGEHLWLLLAMVFGHGSLCATRPVTGNSS